MTRLGLSPASGVASVVLIGLLLAAIVFGAIARQHPGVGFAVAAVLVAVSLWLAFRYAVWWVVGP